MLKGLVILIGLFITANTAYAAPVGTVILVSGDAWVMSGKHKKELHKGDAVQKYQTIITGSKGRVRILMADKSRVYLSPRSRLKLKYYEVQKDSLVLASFKMLWGKVRYFVNKLPSRTSAFNVKTRTAVLGVRGTEFDVNVPMPEGVDMFDPNLTVEQLPPMPTSVDMLSGVVELTNNQGETHQLNKGSSTTVDAEGNVSQMTSDESSPVSEGDESAAEDSPSPAESDMASQAASQSANTAGVGSSVIQGSTITTPYQYRFGGR